MSIYKDRQRKFIYQLRYIEGGFLFQQKDAREITAKMVKTWFEEYQISTLQQSGFNTKRVSLA